MGKLWKEVLKGKLLKVALKVKGEINIPSFYSPLIRGDKGDNNLVVALVKLADAHHAAQIVQS